MCPCYVLRAGDTDMVKIGWADAMVDARRLVLQTAHWEEMAIIRVIEGEPWIERAMHRRFAEYRVKREWFRLHPDMLTFSPTINPARAAMRALRQSKVPLTPIRQVCDLFGGQTALARVLGINQSTISSWVAAGYPPSERIMPIIDAGLKLNPPVLLEPNDFFVLRQPQQVIRQAA